MENNTLATGTKVTINENALLVKQFPSILGAIGTIGCAFSEPNAYNGDRIQLYMVKLPAGVFGGRTVRVASFEMEVV